MLIKDLTKLIPHDIDIKLLVVRLHATDYDAEGVFHFGEIAVEYSHEDFYLLADYLAFVAEDVVFREEEEEADFLRNIEDFLVNQLINKLEEISVRIIKTGYIHKIDLRFLARKEFGQVGVRLVQRMADREELLHALPVVYDLPSAPPVALDYLLLV